MNIKEEKKGISLIVLVITIIVIIILAVAVILSIANNNPIENAKKARFLNDLKTIQEEINLYNSKAYADAKSNGTEYVPAKIEDIKSAEKYKGKIEIRDGKAIVNVTDKEKEWAEESNIKVLIPDEYQEVEYIESTGTQYIDTKVEANLVYGYEIRYKSTGIVNQYKDIYYLDGIMGVNSSNGDIKVWYSYENNIPKIQIVLRNKGVSYTAFSNVEEYYNTLNNVKVRVDGTVYYNGEKLTQLSGFSDPMENCTISIFNVYDAHIKKNHFSSKTKLYIAKLYNKNEELLRDFVPCYRKSDGVIGLYDRVENKFYTNLETGSFQKGEDVNNIEI